MDGLVSIITPTYNSERFVADSIKSVQSQTYTNWELIIVDDASTDNTMNLISKYATKDHRIKIFQLSNNCGAAVARNLAIEKAKGHYLAFLDADDLWLPQFIEKSISKIKTTGTPFIFSSYKLIDEEGVIKSKIITAPEKVTYTDLLKTNSIGCLTAFIDLYQLEKLEMPLLRARQDLGLWLKYLKKIPYAESIKEPLALYRVRKGSLSSNKWDMMKSQWYIYRKLEDLSILSSFYYLVYWMYSGLKKHYF